MWKDVNLLSISQLTVGKYGRKVGSLLWSEDEIIGHMISPQKTRPNIAVLLSTMKGSLFGRVSDPLDFWSHICSPWI